MKKITIKTCEDCPHERYESIISEIAEMMYIPVCNITNKDIPCEPELIEGAMRSRITQDTPDWCPLDDDIGPALDLAGAEK
jgi:hypothetical protein